MVNITLFYAGLIGLLMFGLAVRVIQARRSAQVSLGHGDDKVLNRRMRAFGNCTEYAPMVVLLMALLELNETPAFVLHAIGLALVVGRVMHGWAFSFTDGNMQARVGGMLLTFFALVVGSVAAVSFALV